MNVTVLNYVQVTLLNRSKLETKKIIDLSALEPEIGTNVTDIMTF